MLAMLIKQERYLPINSPLFLRIVDYKKEQRWKRDQLTDMIYMQNDWIAHSQN